MEGSRDTWPLEPVKNLSVDCLFGVPTAGKPHSVLLLGLSSLALLTRLISCSPVSEAVMSLHSAWRAGLGRPESGQRSRCYSVSLGTPGERVSDVQC